MKTVFQDMQDENNERNGTSVSDLESLRTLFKSFEGRQPFGFVLVGDNGITLTIGFAGNCGSVQYSPSDGSPPYLMAVADDAVDDGKFVEFLAGNTPTPIPRRFCLPADEVEKIVAEFVTHDGKSEAVAWEEI